MKLNARELRDLDEKEVQDKLKQIKRHPIYFILENIYDTYNVGGLFRLADAITVEKMYLCGVTEIPPNHKVRKASIGTYKVVPWEYKQSASEAIQELRKITNFQLPISNQIPNSNSQIPKNSNLSMKQCSNETIKIVAVEQHAKSVDYRQIDYKLPLALVFGNETSGVTQETLNLVDQIAEIPMWGINRSLNVIVSATIVSYYIADRLKF